MRLIALLFCFFALHFSSSAQGVWTDSTLPLEKSNDGITYQQQRIVELNLSALHQHLKYAPLEFSEQSKNNTATINLPFPDGENIEFRIVESPVMMPKLAAKFPNIKSYKAIAAHDRSMVARLDMDKGTFHASIKTKEGRIYIDPILEINGAYRSFYTNQAVIGEELQGNLKCGTSDTDIEITHFDKEYKDNSKQEKSGNSTLGLQTYRLAMTCTGEYAQSKGGTVAGVIASFNTAANRLNAIYEIEAAMRFILIDNNDELVFLDAEDDPFPQARDGLDIRNRTPAAINDIIGVENYDIGHAFTRGCDGGLGGVAAFEVICQDNKGLGMTCHFGPNVDFVVVNTMAHEVGHQFGASHSWNNCPSSLDQRATITAYEPGGGSTIMSYAGACGNQNIAGTNDDYFHSASIEQIIDFGRDRGGNACAELIDVQNDIPIIELSYKNDFFIPISTPFELEAIATDIDNGGLTYCWEQFDLQSFPIAELAAPEGNAPTFRSFPPMTSPTRVFPQITSIINNRSSEAEQLPTYSRDLTFRCTVRDNHPEAGAVAWDEVAFKSDETAGPFLVTYPNSLDIELEGGSYHEITWDVANTDNRRVNCQRVSIKLSTDGGRNYPITLVEQTANDGSAFVTLPNITSNSARIKVEAADNIFFDISNRNFKIIEPSKAGFAVQVSPAYQEVCLPNMIEININTTELLDFDSTVVLSLENVPDGISASLSSNRVLIGENTTLTLTIEELGASALLSFDLIAMVEGVDTLVRPIEIDAVSNDFSALELTVPANNTKGIVGTTDFIWTELDNAITYDFELASSPTFGETVVASFSDLTNTMVRPDIFLEESTIYYWRIRPKNQCGEGAFSIPNVFQTINVQCLEFEKEEDIVIVRNGTPTVESILTVENDGVVTDLNVPLVTGGYQPVRFIEISLISPAGTQVVLFDDLCGSTRDFNLGFDDEAPDEITCPPTAGVTQKPVELLANFDGENIKGDWTMRFRVKQAGFGAGGSLGDWSMESCGDIPVSAPFLVTNDTLEIPPSERSQIWIEDLEADDEDNRPEEISFRLVSVPAYGTLYRNETPLQVGDAFTQQDIDGFLISYEHNGSPIINDRFDFVLIDTDGGWFGTIPFHIKIDETATVDTDDISLSDHINIYPNPTSGQLQIEFKNLSPKGMLLQLFDLNGKLLKELRNFAGDNATLDMSQFANGIYLLSVQSEQGRYMEKVVVQK